MEKIEIGTYYFSMDCGWLSDPKILVMIDELSYCSIGIYVTIITWLYQEKGVLNKKHYRAISRQLNCDIAMLKKVVENYDLFFFEGDEFSSKRVREDMEQRIEMSIKGKAGAKKRWENKGK